MNTYRHWMTNIRDWNISRQLWWGQQIPAYYYGSGKQDFVVAITKEEALEKARKKTKNPSLKEQDLRQEEDVLDASFRLGCGPFLFLMEFVFQRMKKFNITIQHKTW